MSELLTSEIKDCLENGAGTCRNVVLIDELRAELARRDEYISKLEAKIPKLNIDLAEASMHAYNGESARMELEAELDRMDEIIARLIEDAERLANSIEPQWSGYFHSLWCNECYSAVDGMGKGHKDDCPITLHRALMKELE